jgi:uncharacterized integral membrane protein
MVAVAVVLILAAVILTIGAVLGGSETTNFDIFQGSVSATGTQIFLLGLVTGLLFIVGGKTLRIGARRARQQGKELRELRAKQRELEGRERDTERESDDDDGNDEPAKQSTRNPFDIDDTSFRGHRFRDLDDQ